MSFCAGSNAAAAAGLSSTAGASVATSATGAITLESDVGDINYIINEEFTMTTQQPVDQGKAFETAAGTNTSSTEDDILDFSERNPFGEVDDY